MKGCNVVLLPVTERDPPQIRADAQLACIGVGGLRMRTPVKATERDALQLGNRARTGIVDRGKIDASSVRRKLRRVITSRYESGDSTLRGNPIDSGLGAIACHALIGVLNSKHDPPAVGGEARLTKHAAAGKEWFGLACA